MNASSLTNLPDGALFEMVLAQKARFDAVAEMSTEARNAPKEKALTALGALLVNMTVYLPMLETELRRRGFDPSEERFGLNLTELLTEG